MVLSRCLVLLPLSSLLFLAQVCYSATYYVDFVNGNDSNSGTSKSSPWKRCPGMAGAGQNYSHAFPSLKEKPVATITNGYDAADFAGPVTQKKGKFRIVHTGYLHTEMGLQVQRRRRAYELLGGMESGVNIATRSHLVLIKAIERWAVQRPEILADLELTFAGVVTAQDKAAAETSQIGRCVRFTGYVSHTESVQLVRTADLLFLPMHNLPAGKRSRIVPGKAYEYMSELLQRLDPC